MTWARSPAFRRWMEKPHDAWPLAVLSRTDAEATGAGSRVAWLSSDTAEKQRRMHPELAADEYAYVQWAMDRPDVRVVEDNPKTGTRNIIYHAS